MSVVLILEERVSHPEPVAVEELVDDLTMTPAVQYMTDRMMVIHPCFTPLLAEDSRSGLRGCRGGIVAPSRLSATDLSAIFNRRDGERPINYGWLPPGRVTDGSAGTSTFSDCINWMGFNELVRVLERIDHDRAGVLQHDGGTLEPVAGTQRLARVDRRRAAPRVRKPRIHAAQRLGCAGFARRRRRNIITRATTRMTAPRPPPAIIGSTGGMKSSTLSHKDFDSGGGAGGGRIGFGRRGGGFVTAGGAAGFGAT